MTEKKATDISIYGHKFTLRGPTDAEYMKDLAAKVDERMREVAKPGEPIHRVAILAALVLTDEVVKLRRAVEQERQRFDQAARSAAQLDLRLQALLSEAVQAEKAGPPLDVEEQPEVLDVDVDGKMRDLFRGGA